MKLQAPVSEEDIMSHWLYTDKVYISCVCITFNQELYVRDAIDGFLAQVTEYKFEIVIHDDLSTDKTRAILKEYKSRYPSIINLVLQKQNQYSLGKKIIPIAANYAEGDYIALCEGDDFWVDKYKLQRQVKVLLNDKYAGSFSSALTDENRKVGYQNSKDVDIQYNTLLKYSGDIIPTASLMFNKKVMSTLPPFFDELPIGDYYLQLLIASAGEIYYHKDVFSFYRVHSSGSWSLKNSTRTEEVIIKDYHRYYNSSELFFSFIGQSSLKAIKLLKLNTAVELFKIRAFKEIKKLIKDLAIFDFKGKLVIKLIFLKVVCFLYRG
ncbi:glycosyltransferase [Vibrio breoganii]